MKNYNAIDKIISELALTDYKRVNGNKRPMAKNKPYSLGQETTEALKIKKQYSNDEITEEQYKAYCLKYNLITR